MVDLRNPLRAAAEPPSQPFPLFRTAFPSHFSCHSARDQRLSFLSLWCCFQHRTTQTDAFPCGAASNTGLHRRGSEHQEAAVLWLQGQQRDVTESYGCVRSAECTYSAVNNYGVRSAEYNCLMRLHVTGVAAGPSLSVGTRTRAGVRLVGWAMHGTAGESCTCL